MSQRPLVFPESTFDPSTTLDSGQAFRWSPLDEGGKTWFGIVSDIVLKVTRKDAQILSGNGNTDILERYFSVKDDIDSIFRTFPHDEILESSRNQLPGLRLLTQDPWECLISFVCSINCNIPSIRLKIENLSRRYGKKLQTDVDIPAYSFPTPESLARATRRDLLDCRLGFRWKYVKFIAKSFTEGRLDLEKLRCLSYHDALANLISKKSGNTFGVGPKVADCTLLYSLHKTEAFPMDIWILRCLDRFYRDEAGRGNLKSLSSKKYFVISENMRKRFGKYAGYAQLYLYVKMRRDFNHSI